MKTIKFAFIFAILMLYAAACAAEKPSATQTANTAVNTTAPGTAPNDEFALAKANYEKHKCVVCHKENGEGGKDVLYGDITIDEVPSFKNPKVAAEPDAEYVKKIERGGDGMPKYKDKLSSEEITALVRYIRREFQGK